MVRVLAREVDGLLTLREFFLAHRASSGVRGARPVPDAAPRQAVDGVLAGRQAGGLVALRELGQDLVQQIVPLDEVVLSTEVRMHPTPPVRRSPQLRQQQELPQLPPPGGRRWRV